MSVSTTTRRAVLAGAALPALAVCGASVPQSSAAISDPIFAAINEHRTAFSEHLELITDTPKADDDLICEGEAYDRSRARRENAAIALTNVKPTTLAGTVALLAHINDFNHGAIVSTRRPSCYSEHVLWPETLVDDRESKNSRGQELRLPFAFWVLENVREAIEAIAESV